MKLKTLLYLCALFFLQGVFTPAFAQNLQVTGRVTSKLTGEALTAVTVKVKGD
jgi:hypothetical protein